MAAEVQSKLRTLSYGKIGSNLLIAPPSLQQPPKLTFTFTAKPSAHSLTWERQRWCQPSRHALLFASCNSWAMAPTTLGLQVTRRKGPARCSIHSRPASTGHHCTFPGRGIAASRLLLCLLITGLQQNLPILRRGTYSLTCSRRLPSSYHPS
jgi:hypothetical protein